MDTTTATAKRSLSPSDTPEGQEISKKAKVATDGLKSLLPPSTFLHRGDRSIETTLRPPMETDVGILEYVGSDIKPFQGIIKQRFTDFLVYEIGQDGQTIHLKDITQPHEPPLPPPPTLEEKGYLAELPPASQDVVCPFEENPKWPSTFSQILIPLLGLEKTTEVRNLWLEGKLTYKKAEGAGRNRPSGQESRSPFVGQSDSGWGSKKDQEEEANNDEEKPDSLRADTSTSQPEDKEAASTLPSQESGKNVVVPESAPSSVEATNDAVAAEPTEEEALRLRGGSGRDNNRGGRGGGRGGGGRGGGRGRGGRGGRGGGRGGRGGGGSGGGRDQNGQNGGWNNWGPEDPRSVITLPILDKAARTAIHQTIRTVFSGALETKVKEEKDKTEEEKANEAVEGIPIIIKFSKGSSGRSTSDYRGVRKPSHPQFIHFTLHKTNRDTQDALAHMARTLQCNSSDLTVAGTKDKRGVTTQRVCLKRGRRSMVDVWRAINGVGRDGDRSMRDVLKERGERGVRVGDFCYEPKYLELGMLKGNEFLITLRNVQVDEPSTIDNALTSIKNRGFINYYGMQRFGTSHIPTHAVGLAMLQEDYALAVDLLLRVRPGEHPDAEAARNIWNGLKDADKALALFPKRCVAERALLEYFKKEEQDGVTERDYHQALLAIPRNLRLIYVHAYQSFLWNIIVSERIREFGADQPVVGDLVMVPEEDVAVEEEDTPLAEEATQNDAEPAPVKRTKGGRRMDWKTTRDGNIKTLTAEDLVEGHSWTIFDVIMPIPGFEVDLPGGKLRDMFVEYLRADGLDETECWKKQKDYHLAGSYRKILALPADLSWSRIPYTDPDVNLAQSDEDRILERDPPPTAAENAEGEGTNKFLALQIRLKIGTSSYATMALREVTKTETSAGFQSLLTANSDDQKFRGGQNGNDDKSTADVAVEGEDEEMEEQMELQADDQAQAEVVSGEASAEASPAPTPGN